MTTNQINPPISFRVTPAIRKCLEEYAVKNGFLSVSDATRDIVRRELINTRFTDSSKDL